MVAEFVSVFVDTSNRKIQFEDYERVLLLISPSNTSKGLFHASTNNNSWRRQFDGRKETEKHIGQDEGT